MKMLAYVLMRHFVCLSARNCVEVTCEGQGHPVSSLRHAAPSMGGAAEGPDLSAQACFPSSLNMKTDYLSLADPGHPPIYPLA